jgi:prepilin peptidase CpaA
MAALIATGIAAIIDLRTGHIPNRLTLGAFALGVGGHVIPALAHGGLAGAATAFAETMIGAALGGAVPFLLWRMGALGGGDVKLFAALGALLGPFRGLEAQLMSFACAALVFPLQLAWQGRLVATLLRSAAVVANAMGPKRKPVDSASMIWFRLGPAIFAGTALSIVLRR